MSELSVQCVATPLGVCRVEANALGVARVQPVPGSARTRMRGPARAEAIAARAAAALRAYFAGERRDFDDVPLALDGTRFQLAVWEALRAIPYGTTLSYGALAHRLGRAGASRAVGLANHRNPAWVIVPCHRVVQSDGGLGGYAGGVQVKRWLLEHEGARSLPRQWGARWGPGAEAAIRG